MSNYCVFCAFADNNKVNEDKERWCNLLEIYTPALKCCPGWKAVELTAEEQAAHNAERERLLALSNSNTVQTKPVATKPKISKSVKIAAESIETDYTEEEKQVTLFEHQKLARSKFKDLNEIALFFEMGCGKSVTSLSIMIDKYKEGKINSLLIVAPNDVHKQWFDDLCNEDALLAKILEQENVPCTGQILGGRGGQKQFYDFEDDGKLHIVCVNIDTFSQPHKWEEIVDWVNDNKTAIIVDEATSIKNPSSKRSQRMLYEFNDVVKRGKTIVHSSKRPNTVVRCVLTGTPVSNGPMDLWSIMEFVKPNYFDRNYYSFMNYYGMHTKLTVQDRQINVLLTEKTWHGIKGCKNYAEAFNTFGCSEDTYMTIMHQDHYIGPYKHADELKALLEPVAVFAKLTDCVDMPPVHYITKEVPLSDAQKACYNDMKHDLLATYDDNVATAKNKLVVTLRLQQIASGFIMGHKEVDPEDLDLPLWSDVELTDDYDVAPDEVIWLGDTNPKLEQLMRDVAELDKPLLILTRFSAEAAKIYELCEKAGYRTGLYTGWKVVGGVDAFKKGDLDILVANTTKIARGHNLQIAHTTIYYSNTFSMELRQQSEFRTFRMGQKYPCTYIDYVSCEVDKTITEALRLKKGLLEYIRDKDIKEVV